MSEDEAKELILQILLAIEYCHSNKIIHRDLKFQNIMLNKKPDTSIIPPIQLTDRMNSHRDY